jgi:hypothetical protein
VAQRRSCLAENLIQILTFTEISATLSTLDCWARGPEEIEGAASVRGAIWGLEKAVGEIGETKRRLSD